MDRVERAQAWNERMKAQRTAIEDTLPAFANESMKLANGDAAKGREVAAILVDAVPLLTVLDWEVNMTTNPGDLVRSPDGKFVYAYSGKAAMKHTNSTFYPGSVGVYYWAIVPNTRDGIPIFPDVQGIIVAVKKDQLWYDVTGATLYRWNAADWTDCPYNYPPGAVGVHQWEEVANV